MDEFTGPTVADHLLKGQALLEEAFTTVTDTAEVCSGSHGHVVPPLDLKPANLTVTTDGQVEVLDFGLAKRVDARCDAESEAAGVTAQREEDRLSPDDAVVGTVWYVPPERAEDR